MLGDPPSILLQHPSRNSLGPDASNGLLIPSGTTRLWSRAVALHMGQKEAEGATQARPNPTRTAKICSGNTTRLAKLKRDRFPSSLSSHSSPFPVLITPSPPRSTPPAASPDHDPPLSLTRGCQLFTRNAYYTHPTPLHHGS